MVRETLKGVLAIAATTLGLLIVAVFYETAIAMASAWWEWAIGLLLATGLALGGLALIYTASAATVAVAAAGWVGVLSGRVPHGFGARDGNPGRALGNLVLFGAALYVGLRLYRAGRLDGELNWAVEGLFLIAAGIAFGLLPAIPRLYFARRGRADRIEPSRGTERGGVALLVTCALLGVALSMCTANTLMAVKVRDGEATLPHSDWIEGCLDPGGDLDGCPRRATFTIVPRHTTRLRVEVLSKCVVALHTEAGEPVPVLDDAAKQRRGIPTGTERNRIVFDPQPGVAYRLALAPAAEHDCTYAVRYLDEPTGSAGAR